MNSGDASPEAIGDFDQALDQFKKALVPLETFFARLRDQDEKLWTPDVSLGLFFLGISPAEWKAIEDSSREAFFKLTTHTLFPNDDLSRESLLLSIVRTQGVEEAAKNEFVTKALGAILSEGKAEFFERLAATIRETRESPPDALEWMMPADTMKDRATWTLVVGWTRSPFPQYNFPPFAFWTYDAITEFCEECLRINYGREGIRRRISELGLTFASIAWVRGLEHERDRSGFRLIYKKRRRSVKGHKSDKKP